MAAPTQLEIYESLSAPASRKLERCAVAIDKANAKGIELIFEIGKQLQIAHDELANHGDGTFGKWCVERCGMSKRQAYRFLNINEVFGTHKQLVCAGPAQTFDVQALEYLSREVTPEDAIADAIKAAKKGERITLARAKEFVAEYTVDEYAVDEIAADESDDDEPEESEWDWAICEAAIERTTNQFWRTCPASERVTIVNSLRFIANKMEKRINGNAT